MKMEKEYTKRGLSAAEVLASRKAHGSNILTPREQTPWWRKLAEKFTDPLIIILLVAAILSIGISCYEYFGLHQDASVFFEPVGIFIAIFLATGLAFVFEVIFDSICETSMLKVSGSISANTGFAPRIRIASVVATKV